MKRFSCAGGVFTLLLTAFGCSSQRAPDDDGNKVAVEVAALNLQTLCSMTIHLENSYTDVLTSTTIINWTQDLTLDANNMAQWIGPCVVAQDVDGDGTADAGAVGSQNTMSVTIIGYTTPGVDGICGTGDDLSPTIADPTPEAYTCVEQEDVRVSFDITLLYPAYQGAVDVTFDYDEVFCSCKDDCLDDFLPDPTETSWLEDGTCSAGGATQYAGLCPDGTPCNVNGDCLAGTTCNTTVGPVYFVEPCATSADCPANTCSPDACINHNGRCDEDADGTADGRVCNSTADCTSPTALCLSWPDTLGCSATGSACTTSNDCPGTFCTASNAPCDAANTCDAQVCQGATLIHTQGQRAPTLVPGAVACTGGEGTETAVGLLHAKVCCCVDLVGGSIVTLGQQAIAAVTPPTTGPYTFTLANAPVILGSVSIQAVVNYDVDGANGADPAGETEVLTDPEGDGTFTTNAVSGTGVASINYTSGAVAVIFSGTVLQDSATPGSEIQIRYSYTVIGPDGHCDSTDPADPGSNQCVEYNAATGWPASNPPVTPPWYGGAEEYDGSETITADGGEKEYNNHAVAFDIDWFTAHADPANGWCCKMQVQTEVDWTDDGTDPESLQGNYTPGDFSIATSYKFCLDNTKGDGGLAAMCGEDVHKFDCEAEWSDLSADQDTNDLLAYANLNDPIVNSEISIQATPIKGVPYRISQTKGVDVLGFTGTDAIGKEWVNTVNRFVLYPVWGVTAKDDPFVLEAHLTGVTQNGIGVTGQALGELLAVKLYTIDAGNLLKELVAQPTTANWCTLAYASADGGIKFECAPIGGIVVKADTNPTLVVSIELRKELGLNDTVRYGLEYYLRGLQETSPYPK